MQYQQLSSFPEQFMWGASISAYQAEGAYQEDGKLPSIIDEYQHDEDVAGFEVASDFYHHYKEDILLFKELGLKAFRFSIAWTRIMGKNPGETNEKGINFYHRVIDECLENGIEPIVTMYHFDLPYHLEEQGGWLNRQTIDCFLDYVKVLFAEYGDKVNYWLTINEQNTMILHPGAIGLPKDGSLPSKKELFQINHHVLLAQAQAIALYHQLDMKGKIGPAINLTAMYQATANPEDAIAAHNWETLRGWSFLDAAVRGKYNYLFEKYLNDRDIYPKIEAGDFECLAAGKPDFIAINYYSTATIAASKNDGSDVSARAGDQQIMLGEEGVYRAAENPYVDKTPYGWVVDPTGLRLTLRKLYDRYELPILITENGYGAPDTVGEDGKIQDNDRIDYLQKHIFVIQEALTDGVDVIGYCPWSAIDVVSTHQGFNKRYGFIYVDRTDKELKTLKRIKKESFYWYQKVISQNGLS
ncbi:glycoside hydrolase family 1 protein [Enterococcus sp. 669A]|uniref:Glycoside hydrolase family 1 protein n=1 Tax=Candidatus Enterococcus moelleringii TaxID=2815325 RepID=A0ABS3L5K9_9ENTE|nr:glycoside hydrolase family 1 protein [Enterococcus sp. 669A]